MWVRAWRGSSRIARNELAVEPRGKKSNGIWRVVVQLEVGSVIVSGNLMVVGRRGRGGRPQREAHLKVGGERNVNTSLFGGVEGGERPARESAGGGRPPGAMTMSLPSMATSTILQIDEIAQLEPQDVQQSLRGHARGLSDLDVRQ